MFPSSTGLDIPLVPDPRCRFCSKPVPEAFSDWRQCHDCTGRLRKDPSDHHRYRPYYFLKATSAGMYIPDLPGKGTMGKLIMEMKKGIDHSSIVVEALDHIITKDFVGRSFDVIVPIPSNDNTLGPSSLIGDRLAVKMGVPLMEAISFSGHGLSSKTLIGEEKFNNARGRVVITGGQRLEGLHILLVDDIITTCGTAHWCSELLLSYGAATVFVVSACRNVRKDHLDFIGYAGRY